MPKEESLITTELSPLENCISSNGVNVSKNFFPKEDYTVPQIGQLRLVSKRFNFFASKHLDFLANEKIYKLFLLADQKSEKNDTDALLEIIRDKDFNPNLPLYVAEKKRENAFLSENEGNFPLFFFVFKCFEPQQLQPKNFDYYKLINALLEKGANPNIQMTVMSPLGSHKFVLIDCIISDLDIIDDFFGEGLTLPEVLDDEMKEKFAILDLLLQKGVNPAISKYKNYMTELKEKRGVSEGFVLETSLKSLLPGYKEYYPKVQHASHDPDNNNLPGM